jgi:hypothetical protein
MRFYRQAHAKYRVNFINGINYVIVTKTPPGTHLITEAYYELQEKDGRYSLNYIDALPEREKQAKPAQTQ